MAKTYFLNAQNGEISIELNSGSKHVLAALNSESEDPFCSLDLRANKNKDVLGTDAVNNLTVITTRQKDSINLVIEMDGIQPDKDIQFLLFDNQVLARQGMTAKGFKIGKSG